MLNSRSVKRALVTLAAAIFIGEVLIMTALPHLPFEGEVAASLVDASLLIAIVFPVLYIFVLRSMVSTQTELEKAIHQRTADIERSRASLEDSVAKLKRQQDRMQLLREAGNLFQACRDVREGMTIAQAKLGRMFPGTSGSLLLLNPSRNNLEEAVAWGNAQREVHTCRPDCCWALRLGKPQVRSESDGALACRSKSGHAGQSQLSLPLMANGESLGVLCVSTDEPLDSDDEQMEFLVAASENLSLAIANLRLQEKLRWQALRDPLTGLYNRRYLLDAFDREIERAGARGQAFSVVMLDLDHFKQFNDSFGHAEGDAALARLGEILRDWGRPDDILVRYGGEEFTIILPETGTEDAQLRMEALRQKVASSAWGRHGSLGGRVTISAGIATFPLHGRDRDGLIAEADAALYQSKRQGRNRVAVAEPSSSGETPRLAAAG